MPYEPEEIETMTDGNSMLTEIGKASATELRNALLDTINTHAKGNKLLLQVLSTAIGSALGCLATETTPEFAKIFIQHCGMTAIATYNEGPFVRLENHTGVMH